MPSRNESLGRSGDAVMATSVTVVTWEEMYSSEALGVSQSDEQMNTAEDSHPEKQSIALGFERPGLVLAIATVAAPIRRVKSAWHARPAVRLPGICRDIAGSVIFCI